MRLRAHNNFMIFIVRFYLPHGITVDGDDNFWVTDVALQQVIVRYHLIAILSYLHN